MVHGLFVSMRHSFSANVLSFFAVRLKKPVSVYAIPITNYP